MSTERKLLLAAVLPLPPLPRFFGGLRFFRRGCSLPFFTLGLDDFDRRRRRFRDELIQMGNQFQDSQHAEQGGKLAIVSGLKGFKRTFSDPGLFGNDGLCQTHLDPPIGKPPTQFGQDCFRCIEVLDFHGSNKEKGDGYLYRSIPRLI